MADVVFVLITVAFFAATVGLVRLCDRIIGPDGAEVTERIGSDDVDRELIDVSSGQMGGRRQ
jgi:hypothetical protein